MNSVAFLCEFCVRGFLASRVHCFLISGSDNSRVKVLAESDDLAVANCKDVNEIRFKLAACFLDPPLVMAKRHYFVALRHEFARLEFEHFLIARDCSEKISHAIAAGSYSPQWYTFHLRQLPGNVG